MCVHGIMSIHYIIILDNIITTDELGEIICQVVFPVDRSEQQWKTVIGNYELAKSMELVKLHISQG